MFKMEIEHWLNGKKEQILYGEWDSYEEAIVELSKKHKGTFVLIKVEYENYLAYKEGDTFYLKGISYPVEAIIMDEDKFTFEGFSKLFPELEELFWDYEIHNTKDLIDLVEEQDNLREEFNRLTKEEKEALPLWFRKAFEDVK